MTRQALSVVAALKIHELHAASDYATTKASYYLLCRGALQCQPCERTRRCFPVVIFWLVLWSACCAYCNHYLSTTVRYFHVFQPMASGGHRYSNFCCVPWCPHSGKLSSYTFAKCPVPGCISFTSHQTKGAFGLCVTFISRSLFVLLR